MIWCNSTTSNWRSQDVNKTEKSVTVRDIDSAPDTLSDAQKPIPPEEASKLLTHLGQLAQEKSDLLQENHNLKLQIKTEDTLNKMMEPTASNVFIFMCIYCTVVAGFLFGEGLPGGFDLPDSVVEILVGSTAVTVIGLVGTVVTGIFIGARRKR